MKYKNILYLRRFMRPTCGHNSNVKGVKAKGERRGAEATDIEGETTTNLHTSTTFLFWMVRLTICLGHPMSFLKPRLQKAEVENKHL